MARAEAIPLTPTSPSHDPIAAGVKYPVAFHPARVVNPTPEVTIVRRVAVAEIDIGVVSNFKSTDQLAADVKLKPAAPVYSFAFS
jgi:hypothetical protein